MGITDADKTAAAEPFAPRVGIATRWVGPTLLGAALLALAYARTFAVLARTWAHNPNYSHGFLIPPVSLFLAWRMRSDLARTPVRPSWRGLALVLPGAALHLAGIRGDVTMFQAYSFILMIAGLVWCWFGGRMLRRLAFPIAFLVFMAPTFPIVVNQLGFRLKTLAAFGSVELAQAMGVAVTRRGMDLALPTGRMTIEGACSGLNSLIALLALGSLFAWSGTGPGWRRVLLFMLSVPVAVAANIVRITSLCVVAAMTTTERATGLFHDIGGFVLFSVALLCMAALKRILRC
jgi:exosortase